MLIELWRGGTTPDESETLEGETKSEVQLCPTHLSLVEHLRQNGQWVIILWQESCLIDFCSCSMCFLFYLQITIIACEIRNFWWSRWPWRTGTTAWRGLNTHCLDQPQEPPLLCSIQFCYYLWKQFPEPKTQHHFLLIQIFWRHGRGTNNHDALLYHYVTILEDWVSGTKCLAL